MVALEPSTAQTALYIITAVAVVIWLVALQFVLISVQARRRRVREACERLGVEVSDILVFGSAEVDGQPRDLSSKAAAALAAGQPLGPVKIAEKTDSKIAFERGSGDVGMAVGALSGQFQFTPSGTNRTQIDFAASMPRLRVFLWLAFTFLAIGFLAIVVGFWAMQTFVVSHPSANVRGQVFQMAQAAHFLWPPFLFAALYRRMDRGLQTTLEAFAQNLPFVK